MSKYLSYEEKLQIKLILHPVYIIFWIMLYIALETEIFMITIPEIIQLGKLICIIMVFINFLKTLKYYFYIDKIKSNICIENASNNTENKKDD